MKSFYVCLFTIVLFLCGCSTTPEPFDYQSDREMKPGPGLFTGESGMLTIIGNPSSEKEDEDK